MKVWLMVKVKVSSFREEDREKAVRMLRSIKFKILPGYEEDGIIAVPAGVRLGEVDDLRSELRSLDSRIVVAELEK